MTPYETYKKAVEEKGLHTYDCECKVQDSICHYRKDDLQTLTIALLDGEISRMNGEMFESSGQAGQFALHTDGFNNALEEQIDYLRSEREKIANEK